MRDLTSKLDKFAISFSALCVVHCLLLPLITALLPAVGAMFFSDESFHRWLLLGVLLTSLGGLTLGCKKHKQWQLFGYGSFGIAVLLFAAFFAHDLMPAEGEKLLTIFGSLIVAFSHYKNFNACQTGRCH